MHTELNVNQLIDAHWFVGGILVFFFLVFALAFACFLVYCVLNFVGSVFTRLLRMIHILFRGWPPRHLDADGDHPEDDAVTAK